MLAEEGGEADELADLLNVAGRLGLFDRLEFVRTWRNTFVGNVKSEILCGGSSECRLWNREFEVEVSKPVKYSFQDIQMIDVIVRVRKDVVDVGNRRFEALEALCHQSAE